MVDNRAERPLLVISDSRSRQQEENEFAVSLKSDFRKDPLSSVEEQIARWRFKRYVRIPLLTALTSLYIRPFWRDRIKAEEIFPLPVIGRSGEIYKNGKKFLFGND